MGNLSYEGKNSKIEPRGKKFSLYITLRSLGLSSGVGEGVTATQDRIWPEARRRERVFVSQSVWILRELAANQGFPTRTSKGAKEGRTTASRVVANGAELSSWGKASGKRTEASSNKDGLVPARESR